MDYTHVLKILEQATTFDLYRLSVAIKRLLADPERVRTVKHALRVGQTVDYFNATENRSVAARVLKLGRTRIDVAHVEDGARWDIPYSSINLQHIDTTVHAKADVGLSPQALSVGDWVGFADKHGYEHCGQVEKLNPKTASVQCPNGRWRVSYKFLFRVLDPDAAALEAIPGEIVKND